MKDFWTNGLLITPISFIYLLVLMIVIFHILLVWVKNLSKENWKRVDYIWLGVAVIGLMGGVSDVRTSVASGWVELEKNRTISSMDRVKYFSKVLTSTQFCIKFSKSEYSPNTFDEVQKQYESACEWGKKTSVFLDSLNSKNIPEIEFDKLFFVNFNNPLLTESVELLKFQVNDYSEKRKLFVETKALSKKTEWEKFLAYFSPFFLCIALALRITKVSGEIKHEKEI